MQSIKSFFRRFPLLPFLTGISLAFGLIVPSIFELTLMKPASRSRYYGMERGAVAVLLVTMVVCVLVMLLQRRTTVQPAVQVSSRKLQFRLRSLFIAMTLTAIVLGVVMFLRQTYANILIVAVVTAIVGWSIKCDRQTRLRTGQILVCMYLPFVWMIAYTKPFGYSTGLAMSIPLCPGIFYAELLRPFANLGMSLSEKLAVLFVIVQLLIGAWIAKRGGKLSVNYAIDCLISSGFSSFVLHALYRM